MNEEEESVHGGLGGNNNGESQAKSRVKKKKLSNKGKDDGSKSVASNEGSQGENKGGNKEQSSSRPPRTKTTNNIPEAMLEALKTQQPPPPPPLPKAGLRRKSAGSRGEETHEKLGMIAKSSAGGKGRGNDDNASAATESSGSQKRGGRKMSPASRGNDESGSMKMKGSDGHRKSGSSKMNASSRSLEQETKKLGMDESNWEVPSFQADNPKDGEGGSANFSATFVGGGAFNDFNDAAFTDNKTFFGSNDFRKKSNSMNEFSDGNDASNFFGTGSAFGGEGAFDNAPIFGAPRRDALNKSPLKNPPKRTPKKLSLLEKTVFAQNFACPPVTNPLNGNIIFCTSRDGEMYIQEVDPKRDFVQVLSSPILTPELHRKVTTKYSRSAYGIDNVLKLCVGIHRSHGQPRVRVVTAIDLLILDSKHILRAIAVWQWGYGTDHPVSLQFLLSPPSGTDYAYNPESLLAADNCVFIAGQSTKGPCVFMCKPSVRESWSANFLAPSGKIMTMAVNSDPKRNYPYLAVGMADGSLSVWTYAAAMKQTASKQNEPFRRLLFPLCRLEALWVLNSLQPTNFTGEKRKKSDVDPKDAGMCISLEWLPPQPSFSSLLLLAASFQGGFAVFHLVLPLLADPSERGKYIPIPAPSQSTQLPATPQIRPFAAIRYPVNYPDTFISWIDFGPHSNPCLALLLHGRSTDIEPGRVVLGGIKVPQYQQATKTKESLAGFCMLTTKAWISKSKTFPLGFLPCNSLNAVMCHVGVGISTLTPALSNSIFDPAVLSLRHPVSSHAFGLSSSGDVLAPDVLSDKDGILHVFSVIQCDLVKNDLEPNILNWSRPARRHWLCRTVCGDRKETRVEEAKEASQFVDDDDLAIGGSSSDVVCELEGEELAGLVPFRIVHCLGSNICAVLFRPALEHSLSNPAGFSLDCVTVVLLDTKTRGNPDIEIVQGRDVTFLPVNKNGVRALVLSRDSASLSVYTRGMAGWEKGTSCRPILGVECNDSFVESQRVFPISEESKYGLAVVGKHHRDNKSCVLRGPLGNSDQVLGDGWTKLLPELTSQILSQCFWLKEDEEVLSLVSLPRSEGVEQKLALSTSSRVLILSHNMTLLSEVRTVVASGTLAPIGSSAVSFCSVDCKIRYLCCLKGKFSTGILATLPMPKVGYGNYLMLAMRPDRFLYLQWQHSASLIEHKEDPDCFMLPTAVTKPAILLEPLIANAVCEMAKGGSSTPLLRSVIERFGRKVASITHGDEEGIGNKGSGITPRVYEILSKYGLKQAASWLLTGGVHFERSFNSKILPPWMPVSAKKEAALNSDAFLHLVANGDQYFSEYIQSPDDNMLSSLPRPADPTPYLCRDFSQEALARGDTADALKMLDLVGTESTDSMLLQLSLMLEIKSGDATDLLKALSGYDELSIAGPAGLCTANTSLAAFAGLLKENGPNPGMKKEQINRWMKPLASSLQRGTKFRRVRQRLLGERSLEKAGGTQAQVAPDPIWQTPCNESRHIWNEGPNKEKENLLLLDKVEDWLGRRRPFILGKAGVAAAEERGEGALANILDMDEEDESAGGKSEDESNRKGWVEGVGEGRLDEENLVSYYRFWEGEDEESRWPTEGLSDLSRFDNKTFVAEQSKRVSLQPTTSSVDEGEPTKVKPLYDLVFEEAADDEPSGLVMAATRGGSLDIGLLHTSDHIERQRCTLEFWYYLPPSSTIPKDIVLARRTIGGDADDFSKVCIATDRRSLLWEVVCRKSGEIEFRTCAGSVLSSKKDSDDDPDRAPTDAHSERNDAAKFEAWNHLCMIFSSRHVDNMANCSVSMFMMGNLVGTIEASMLPAGLTVDELQNSSKIDDLMQKSHLVFGLNHSANFRLTEIRVWACERSEDDIKMMMREYLDAAEARKKKLRVKIGKNKQKSGKGSLLVAPKAGGLAPPKGGLLTPPKAGGLAPPKGPTPKSSALAPPRGSTPTQAGLLTPPKAELLNPPKDRQGSALKTNKSFTNFSNQETTVSDPGFGGSFGGSTRSEPQESQKDAASLSGDAKDPSHNAASSGGNADSADETPTTPTLWDGAVPLSQQVRSSAAAALIRGPPATRHFGGNRGGLPDLRGTDRYGIGGIAICGSEKTIVWRDEEDPPALTYPIGASGAIVSDQLDDEEGSEFLCCFLAKDKRMVVFELNSRTVVVELQMTTKLNFWRFLPPEAGEMTLCFMLITPVGGFHWMPLDDSPRPRQVWKRGPELQGKKIVSYEEGGSNGMSSNDMLSRVGLICVTDPNATDNLEAWIIPICGDSNAVLVSRDVQGAAFCLPDTTEGGAFAPNLVVVAREQNSMKLNIMRIVEPSVGSVGLGESIIKEVLPLHEFKGTSFVPPILAMGHFPDVLICTLGNIIVVIVRSKGVLIAFEFHSGALKTIAKEEVRHYVVDAVMRYSAIEGGAEIVLLLSDNENHKDGRIASFNFRASV